MKILDLDQSQTRGLFILLGLISLGLLMALLGISGAIDCCLPDVRPVVPV